MSARIAEIHIYGLNLPVRGGSFSTARMSVAALDTTLVKIVLDDGTVGWGETCPVGPTYQPHHALGARAALREVAPGLVGASVLPLPLRRAMDGALAGHGYAKAAVEIAALDALGRMWGASLSDLVGGALVDRVPSYYSLGVAEPEEAARRAREKSREGFARIQIKVGSDVAQAVEAVRRVHEAVDEGVRLAVDANRGWTARDALLADAALADLPVVFEQPCSTLAEIEAIRPRLRHPLYLDESTVDVDTVHELVARRLADGFGFKVTRLGGPTGFAAARDLCALRSLPHTCDDAWGTDVIAATCAHLGATVEPRLLEGVWIAGDMVGTHLDPERPVVVREGRIDVPDGPGHGIVPDETALGAPILSEG